MWPYEDLAEAAIRLCDQSSEEAQPERTLREADVYAKLAQAAAIKDLTQAVRQAADID